MTSFFLEYKHVSHLLWFFIYTKLYILPKNLGPQFMAQLFYVIDCE